MKVRWLHWFKERCKKALSRATEDTIRSLVKGGLIFCVFGFLGFLGIETNLIPRPQIWPWKPPDETARIEVIRNKMGDMAGYGFINPVFDEARRVLAGNGSLRFDDDRIEKMRICFALEIPPTPSVDAMLAKLEAKLSPCLKISKTEEVVGESKTEEVADDIRYLISATDVPKGEMLKIKQRDGVKQYFCGCDDDVITTFLDDTDDIKWP